MFLKIQKLSQIVLKEFTFEISIGIRDTFPVNYSKTATLQYNQNEIVHYILYC